MAGDKKQNGEKDYPTAYYIIRKVDIFPGHQPHFAGKFNESTSNYVPLLNLLLSPFFNDA
jgi:hypothetical protein